MRKARTGRAKASRSRGQVRRRKLSAVVKRDANAQPVKVVWRGVRESERKLHPDFYKLTLANKSFPGGAEKAFMSTTTERVTYRSTRGGQTGLTFEEAVMQGLAVGRGLLGLLRSRWGVLRSPRLFRDVQLHLDNYWRVLRSRYE